MKRFIQTICLILVFSTCLVIPASAEEVSPWASSYFMSSNGYLYKTSSTQFQVWFNVTAVDGMAELGASVIEVQKSSDNSNWSTEQTYYKENNSSMLNEKGTITSDHNGYVTFYNGESGYYYRAYIQFYAKNTSGGRGYYDYYTESIKL